MGSEHRREVAGEAQPQRTGTSHSLSPGTASPTARAGQGRAGPGEPGRGPRARGAPAQERSRLTSEGPGRQQWRARREQGQREVPRASLPATSSSAGPTFCHQRGRGRARWGALADWVFR